MLGLEQAIRRGEIYGEAGADIIFIESPQTEQELRDVAGSFEKPTMANMAEGGKSPLFKVYELEEMCFKIAIFPVTCLLMAARAMQRAMETLQSEGSTQGLLDEMMGFEEFNNIIGFPEIRLFEAQYRL